MRGTSGKKCNRNIWWLLFLFLVLSASTVVAERTPEVEVLIARGIEALNRGEFDRARQLLEDAIVQEPDNPEAIYYLGIAYSRMGLYRDAEDLLRKAEELTGENEYISLELGRLYTYRGECRRATERLRGLLRSEDNAVRQTAEDILSLCEPPPIGLTVSASVQYDTNVVLEPRNPPIEAPDREDIKGVFNIDSHLRLFSINNFRVLTRYNLYQSLHRREELTRFNITYQRLNPSVQWRMSDSLVMETGYALEYSRFKGRAYGRSHTFYTNISGIPTRSVSPSVTYEYQELRYWDSPLFRDNSLRSGHKNTFTAEVSFTPDRLQILLSGAYEWTRTKEDYWDYNGYSVGGLLLYHLNWGSIGFEYDLNKSHFRGVFPSVNRKRRDELHEFSLHLLYNLNRHLSIILQNYYSRNISNISIFDYKRNITSLTLRMEVL